MPDQQSENPDVQTAPSPQPPGGRPSFYEHYKKPIWATLITVALAVAALVVYVLFFRNQNAGPDFQGQAKLTIAAPQESPSGSELSYQITITNESNFRLTGLRLELFYPREFTFLDSTPDKQDELARTFTFPDLDAGREQKLVIVGRLEGSVQEIKTLDAKLHYVPENFRSAFETRASVATIILAPDVSLRLIAQPQLVTGQTITYQIQLSNIASRPFSDLLVTLAFPNKFQFNGSADPPPSQNTAEGAQWAVSSLGVGEAKTLTLSGKLFEEPGRESFVQAELLLKNADGNRASAGRSFAFTQIQPSPLLLTHHLADPVDQIVAGQSLKYEIEYENIGEVGLNNVVISVVFQTSVFNLAKLANTNGQVRGNALVFIPASVPELLVVAPREKGVLKFDLPISDKLVANRQKNPRATTRVEYVSRELTEPIAGNTLDFRIQTEVALTAAVKVIDGPNPPVAGQSTTYQVDLSVSNSVNDVTDAILLATVPRADLTFLPDSITPAEEKNNVQFVPVAGRFSWSLGRIFALTGSFHDPRTLSFRLTYTPTVIDSFSKITILKDLQLSGTDEFTDKNILSNKIERLNTGG